MKDSVLYIINIILDIIANIFFALYIFIGVSVVTTFLTAVILAVCFVVIQLIQGYRRYVDWALYDFSSGNKATIRNKYDIKWVMKGRFLTWLLQFYCSL